AEYAKAFAEAVNKMLDETPNTDFWYSSGPYDGLADIERRFQIGLEQVERYIDYYARVPDEVIWVAPDGEPAIELEFEVDYDGVKVKGFIDQVVKYVLNREEAVKPRDVKTGNEPSGEFQLATYADYLQQEYDLTVVEGDYLMTGKRGKKQAYIVEYDLSEWTHERLKEEYQWADDVIRNERFEPDPDPKKCHLCGVADSCIYAASQARKEAAILSLIQSIRSRGEAGEPPAMPWTALAELEIQFCRGDTVLICAGSGTGKSAFTLSYVLKSKS